MKEKSYGCPVEFALEILGGKWKSVLLAHLKDGALSYGEIRRRVPGLSDKVLTQRLKGLEASGLVIRSASRNGGRTNYRLSTRGESLRPVLESLYSWGAAAAIETRTPIRSLVALVE